MRKVLDPNFSIVVYKKPTANIAIVLPCMLPFTSEDIKICISKWVLSIFLCGRIHQSKANHQLLPYVPFLFG